MIIQNKDQRYGCFRSSAICENCGKIVLIHGFDWGTEHISINETDKIRNFMREELDKAEIRYCSRCGKKLIND